MYPNPFLISSDNCRNCRLITYHFYVKHFGSPLKNNTIAVSNFYDNPSFMISFRRITSLISHAYKHLGYYKSRKVRRGCGFLPIQMFQSFQALSCLSIPTFYLPTDRATSHSKRTLDLRSHRMTTVSSESGRVEPAAPSFQRDSKLPVKDEVITVKKSIKKSRSLQKSITEKW